MVAHVEAEHLLLEGEPLALVELDVRDRLHGRRTRLAVATRVAEERHDAHVVLAAAGHGVVDDLLVHLQQALAGVPERVERAGLDERLDGPLVEDLVVDPVAEVVEVGERPVLLTLGNDELDEPLAHVAHGREPEGDDRLGAVARAPTGVKSPTDRLTSGTSTSMPIARHSAR